MRIFWAVISGLSQRGGGGAAKCRNYAATHLLVAQLMNPAVKKGGLTDCSGDVPWHVRFESRHAADVATPLDKISAQDSLIASERTCVQKRQRQKLAVSQRGRGRLKSRETH